MQVTILAVGSIKEKFYREAIKEFEKRLSRYWDNVNTSYDKFIRTTDDSHEAEVQKIFKKN